MPSVILDKWKFVASFIGGFANEIDTSQILAFFPRWCFKTLILKNFLPTASSFPSVPFSERGRNIEERTDMLRESWPRETGWDNDTLDIETMRRSKDVWMRWGALMPVEGSIGQNQPRNEERKSWTVQIRITPKVVE
jgi:hypothetical protein